MSGVEYGVITIEIHPPFTWPLTIKVYGDHITYNGNIDAEKSPQSIVLANGNILITPAEYNDMTKELKVSSLIVKYGGGLDGGTSSVSLENGWNKITCKWWYQCPEEWKGLDVFVHRVVDFINQKRNPQCEYWPGCLMGDEAFQPNG